MYDAGGRPFQSRSASRSLGTELPSSSAIISSSWRGLAPPSWCVSSRPDGPPTVVAPNNAMCIMSCPRFPTARISDLVGVW